MTTRADRRGGRGKALLAAAVLPAVVLLLLPPAPASALVLNAGFSLPSGNLGDRAGLGYNLGATMSFPLGPLAAWGVQATYHRLPVDDDWSPAPEVNDPGGAWKSLEGLAVLRASLPGGPFAMAGLGLARTWADLELGDADGSTDLAYLLGGGYGFTILEVRALWHGRGGDAGSILSLAAGLRF